MRERERERERGTNSFWSSSISSFFWHPVVGFAMLNCKTKTNVTISVYVFVCVCVCEREREREREHLHLGVELADAAANEEEVRLVLPLGFCMMRSGEIRCGFFILWFWVFSQRNGGQGPNLDKWIRHQ